MRRAFATLGGNPIKQAIPLEKMDKTEVDLQDWFNQSILPSADLNNKNKYGERRTQLGWENCSSSV
jgi:hypothetical protein